MNDRSLIANKLVNIILCENLTSLYDAVWHMMPNGLSWFSIFMHDC